jgi:hypothetical protein
MRPSTSTSAPSALPLLLHPWFYFSLSDREIEFYFYMEVDYESQNRITRAIEFGKEALGSWKLAGSKPGDSSSASFSYTG